MGATTSSVVQGPNEAYSQYRDMIQQTIVPPNVISKGDSAFKSMNLYRYANDIAQKPNILRPVRLPKQAYYATRPTFLGKNGPSHLIGTITEKTLQQVPTSLSSEESKSINIAYKILLHTLNICAIILGSETPGPEEQSNDRTLLQTLQTLYKTRISKVPTSSSHQTDTSSISRNRMVLDIISNAAATIANIEDRAQQLRKENAFLVFQDNRSIIQEINQYITPRKEPSPSSSSGEQTDQLNIFRAVLHHVNTLTVCGVKSNTLLGRLSKSGEYPDILTVVAADMATLMETLLPTKSSTIRTMVRWAKMRLQNATAYGSPGDIAEGAVLKHLFMKQGTALQQSTESACSSLIKQFGQNSPPSTPDGVVVHTADKTGSIKRGDPIKNASKPASRLYTMIQRENRAMADVAIKTFETLFTITPSPVPGTISLPITIHTPETKNVFATVRPDVIQGEDPVATLTGTAAVLVYTVGVSYDNLWTILSKENMKQIYGF